MSARITPLARSWAGLITAVLVAVSASWLLTVYLNAQHVTPIDKAKVEELKQKARTDAETQKILLPELDRQHQGLVRRRNAYTYGGWLLLGSMGVFLVWFKWFRPERGEWVGVPAFVPRLFAREYSDRAKASPPEKNPAKETVLAFAPLVDTVVPRVPRDLDLGPVDEILRAEGAKPESVIPILQAIQAHYRYLPDAALRRVCTAGGITPSQVAGVATFYSQFRPS